MTTAAEIQPSRYAIATYASRALGRPVDPASIEVTRDRWAGIDAHTGWREHTVVIDGCAFGQTDEMPVG